MAKAVIDNIYGKTPRDKDGKTTYSFSVLLSDGVKGNIGFASSPDEYKVGQEIEYSVTEKNGYVNINVKKPGGGRYSQPTKDYSKEKIIVALQCATQTHMHSGLKSKPEDTTATANLYLKRMIEQGI